jgi:hypothetical protein
MSKHLAALSNPTIKEMVIARLKDQGDDFKTRLKKLSGAGATALDEAMFNLPSKHHAIKGIIEGYEKENPNKAKVAKAIGFVGGSIAPGAAGVKVLSKIGKLGKVLKGGGLGQAVSQGAVYGGAPQVVETVAKGKDDPMANGIAGAIEGATLGMAFGGAGKVLSKTAKMFKGKSKFAQKREMVDRIGTDLFKSLAKEDIKAAKNIKANPIDSSYLKLNTLLHRGTPNTKAVIDALYQRSPKVRNIIERQRKALAEGQIPHIEETIIKTGGTGFRPDVEKFAELITKRHQNTVAPLYAKAEQIGEIRIPERLKGDPTFKSSVEKAFKQMNELDKGKKGFEKYSVRNLHQAKGYLYDEIEKLKKLGERTQERNATQAYDMVRDALNKVSPDYQEATNISKKYFDVQKAAKEGMSFKKKGLQETEDLLKNMGEHEKYAYKTGTIQSLLEKAEDRAKNAELGQFGKDITNPQVKQLLNKILGDKKADKLVKNIEVTNESVRNLGDIARGSQTAARESNKSLVLNAIGAAKGKERSIINLVDKTRGKLKGVKADREAKTQMNFLLNPERLLKYETKKVTPNIKGRPKTSAVIIQMRNSED